MQQSVLLEFEPSGEFRSDLSAVVQTGRHLWLASDETATVERLTARDGRIFGDHRSFSLHDFLDLSGDENDEIDIEGLAYDEPYLWVIGSHSVKRKKPEEEVGDTEDRIAELARMEREHERYLIARIPVLQDPTTGNYLLCRSVADPANPGETLTAARTKGTGMKSALMKTLEDDEHLSPFFDLPGKDNGFNVEGLVARGDTIFLGLRGPVLRGWAVILELDMKLDKHGWLKPRKIGPDDARYRKHFVDLGGLGVRELCAQGEDLLVLAGPTMDLDGPVTLFRWKGGLNPTEEALVEAVALEKVMDLPYGSGEDAGRDHAEGISLFADPDLAPSLLVVYDSPAEGRLDGPGRIRADLFELPQG